MSRFVEGVAATREVVRGAFRRVVSGGWHIRRSAARRRDRVGVQGGLLRRISGLVARVHTQRDEARRRRMRQQCQRPVAEAHERRWLPRPSVVVRDLEAELRHHGGGRVGLALDGERKSTRLNSSHGSTSYAVFCLKKKN